MPNAKILQIADNLIAKSAAAGYAVTGLLTDVGKAWHEETAQSAGYLGDAGELNVDGPTRSVSPTAGFFLYSIVQGDAPTRTFFARYKAFKDAVDADPTLGGLCFRARVAGYQGDTTTPSISKRVHVADIFIEVEYRHDMGDA